MDDVACVLSRVMYAMRTLLTYSHVAGLFVLMRTRRDEEREDEREERREDKKAAKGAHFNKSGANKCRDETRMTRARDARDTRDTHDMRMTVRHCHRHTARALSSERAPPPSQHARVCAWEKGKR